MANFRRTAKLGHNWTPVDLDVYNITVVHQTKAEFFGTGDLPEPSEPSLRGFMTTETGQTWHQQ